MLVLWYRYIVINGYATFVVNICKLNYIGMHAASSGVVSFGVVTVPVTYLSRSCRFCSIYFKSTLLDVCN